MCTFKECRHKGIAPSVQLCDFWGPWGVDKGGGRLSPVLAFLSWLRPPQTQALCEQDPLLRTCAAWPVLPTGAASCSGRRMQTLASKEGVGRGAWFVNGGRVSPHMTFLSVAGLWLSDSSLPGVVVRQLLATEGSPDVPLAVSSVDPGLRRPASVGGREHVLSAGVYLLSAWHFTGSSVLLRDSPPSWNFEGQARVLSLTHLQVGFFLTCAFPDFWPLAVQVVKASPSNWGCRSPWVFEECSGLRSRREKVPVCLGAGTWDPVIPRVSQLMAESGLMGHWGTCPECEILYLLPSWCREKLGTVMASHRWVCWSRGSNYLATFRSQIFWNWKSILRIHYKRLYS